MAVQSPAHVVSFARFELEPHVRRAIEIAWALSMGEPLSASHFLQGALRVGRTNTSQAFGKLAELLPLKIDVNMGPRFLSPLDFGAIPLTAPLARSFTLAEKFFTDNNAIWGRDYITLALLSNDPSLEEFVRTAGSEVGRIREAWLDFVSSSDQPRDSRAWQEWWRIAGFAPATKAGNQVTSKTNTSEPEGKLEPFNLAAWDLSFGASEILSTAARAKGDERNFALSTSAVLFAMVEMGRLGTDPQWAPDFLRHFLNDFSVKVAADFRNKSNRGRTQVTSRRMASMMMPGLAWAMKRAQEIAVRTTGSATIAGRHLLAALTLEPPPPHRLGALLRLTENGVDVPHLHERLFDFVRGYGDDDSAWRAILVVAAAPSLRRAEFDADSTTGPDLLGIEQDVVALATLIAARDSSPPLSIGLFGDWGSGKTFFMEKLRRAVAELSSNARKAPVMQRELPFYKHIVQIEFNAWHYVEGNLWASMVEHILANLRTTDQQASSLTERLQKHWIEKLGFAEEAKVTAERKEKTAAEKVADAEVAVNLAKDTHDRKKKEVQRLSQASVTRDFKLSGAFPVVKQSLAPLGLEPLTEAVADLQSSLREARAIVERGNAVLAPLLHASDKVARWRSLVLILVGVPMAAAAVAWLLTALGQEQVANIAAFAAGAAGLLTKVAGWIRKQASWISERAKEIEDAQRVYDEALRKELAAVAVDTAKAEEELQLARQEYLQAQQRAEQARKEQAAAISDLTDATTSRLLGRFIQDRAASNDYRKHLGVLAVVRQDFQQLSQLIEEENWRLSPTNTDSEPFVGRLTRINSLQEEVRDADTRINRIVLYIDDLDRCPPANVVAVLQAVHLLLAFPLFVVVVGVDARWITRSLETRYRELLHVGNVEAADDVAEMFGVARSADYLEKIFQIPMWLRPMDVRATRRMVNGLLRRAGASSTVGNDSSGSFGTEGAASPPPHAAATGPTNAAPQPDGATATKPEVVGSTAAAASSLGMPTGTSRTAPNLESLQLRDFERSSIDALAPLLGRSPRALKRFINLYRLIKAGLTPQEHIAFLRRNEDSLSDYAAVLFLLAVDTGLPRISRAVFDLLVSVNARAQTRQIRMKDLIRELDRDDAISNSDGATLKSWISDQANVFTGISIDRLVKWIPRVSRHSFQADHLESGRDALSRRMSSRKS